MKACGPEKPVGTRVFIGFDIRRSHDEISFRFDMMEKIAEARVHRIILDGLVNRCNAWGWVGEESFPERLPRRIGKI